MHSVVPRTCCVIPALEHVRLATDTKSMRVKGIAHEPSALPFRNDLRNESEDEQYIVSLLFKALGLPLT